jgi:DedD protein
MAKLQTDDELNLRRKARRRLIGAVALTLAVVVILPMVLDSEPNITGKDIDLSIPEPDKAGKFIPRVDGSVVASPPAASAVAATHAKDSTKPVVVPEKTHPSSQKSTESGNMSKPVSAEGFVAQVGAYSNLDTAKQELKKLKQWGFRAYTEKVGDNMRVRVGPYPDRDMAENVGRQLEKHGYHPVIVSAK